jgi:hypothetical protein
MSHIMSDEEYKAYIASQQTDLAEVERLVALAPNAPKPRFQKTLGVFWLVAPASFLICLGLMMWVKSSDDTPNYTDPLDRVLSWAAWFGGREYDPEKHPFSSQYEFKMLESKPIDWNEYGRKQEEMLRSHREQMSRQIRKYHSYQHRAARGN